MFPIALFGALAAVIAWAIRPKDTGVGGGAMTVMGLAQQRFIEGREAPGMFGPPLQPEEECLLCLLTMWAKDKKFPAGQKRYFTRELAVGTAKRAMKLGLRGTAKAVLTDGPIPEDEQMGRRGVTVRQAIIAFNRGKNT